MFYLKICFIVITMLQQQQQTFASQDLMQMRADSYLMSSDPSSALALIDCNDFDLDKYCNCAIDSGSNTSYMICPNLLDDSFNRMPSFDMLESVTIINAFSSWPIISSAYIETRKLDLSHNNLSGAMGSLNGLLDQANNNINDNLKYFNLSYNKLDQLNSQLCYFRQLQVLDLSFNNFETVDFSSLVCRRLLARSATVDERYSSSSPLAVLFLSSLKELYLNNNKIRIIYGLDSILFAMPQMIHLDLNSNNLTSLHLNCYSSKVLINLQRLTEATTTANSKKNSKNSKNNNKQAVETFIEQFSESSLVSLKNNNNLRSVNLNLISILSLFYSAGLESILKIMLKRVNIDLTGNGKIECNCNLYSDLTSVYGLLKRENLNHGPLNKFYLLFDQYSNCIELEINKSISRQYSFYKLINREICLNDTRIIKATFNSGESKQQRLPRRLDVCSMNEQHQQQHQQQQQIMIERDDEEALEKFLGNHNAEIKKSVNYVDKINKHSTKYYLSSDSSKQMPTDGDSSSSQRRNKNNNTLQTNLLFNGDSRSPVLFNSSVKLFAAASFISILLLIVDL